MPNHRSLRKTTRALRIPIKRVLRYALVDLDDARLTTVLKALLYQINPATRVGTLEWICTVIEAEGEEAQKSGNNDLAGKLYHAADKVFDALTAISESSEGV